MFLSRLRSLSAFSKLSLFSLLLLTFAAIAAVSFSLNRQNISGKAWYTSQSVSVSCTSAGVVISASFTNTETNPALGMNVKVTDIQSGLTVDMGSVGAGQTKQINIPTAKSQLNSGNIVFHLTWTSGRSGIDQRTAGYGRVSCSTSSTSPTPVLSLSPTPTRAPTLTPTPTLTITPTPITPTPTPCVLPTQPLCPNGTLRSVTPTPPLCGQFVCVPYTPTPTHTPTPTRMPTPTPVKSPTPTFTPGSTKFSLDVLLHGIGKGGDNVNPNSLGNLDPLHKSIIVTVNVYNTQNQPIENGTGEIKFSSVSGSFKGILNMGDRLIDGTYLLKVKADKYLRAAVPNIVNLKAGEIIQIPKVALPAGDINNDNAINILDYNILAACYSDVSPAKSCSDPAAADLTDDGEVNQFDYNLFLRELSAQAGE